MGEVDAVRSVYVIGLHSETGGKFRKSKFVINSDAIDVDREVYESLCHAYHDVAIA